MNRIDRLIVKTKVNILITILWIIFSGIYWGELDISKYEAYAKDSLNYSAVAFDVEDDNGYILNVTDDPKNSNLNNLKVKVYNETKDNNFYQIALKLDKKCDYSKLSILINEDYYKLSDLLLNEDNKYYYFNIGENELRDGIDIYEISLIVSPDDVEIFLEKDYLLEFEEISALRL